MLKWYDYAMVFWTSANITAAIFALDLLALLLIGIFWLFYEEFRSPI